MGRRMKDVFDPVGFVRPKRTSGQPQASAQTSGGQPATLSETMAAGGTLPMAVDPPLPIDPPSIPPPPPTEDPIAGAADGVTPQAGEALRFSPEALRRVDEAESGRRQTPPRVEVEISSDPSNRGSASNQAGGDPVIPEGIPLHSAAGQSSRKRGRGESSVAGSCGFGRSRIPVEEENGLLNIDGEEALQLLSGRADNLDIRRLEPLSDRERGKLAALSLLQAEAVVKSILDRTDQAVERLKKKEDVVALQKKELKEVKKKNKNLREQAEAQENEIEILRVKLESLEEEKKKSDESYESEVNKLIGDIRVLEEDASKREDFTRSRGLRLGISLFQSKKFDTTTGKQILKECASDIREAFLKSVRFFEDMITPCESY